MQNQLGLMSALYLHLMSNNPRLAAVMACHLVLTKGQSLPHALIETMQALTPANKSLCQEIAYGVLRYYFRYEIVLSTWLKKPIKDTLVALIIMSGFYQLSELRTPSHAAIYETVNLIKQVKKPWAVKLANALLRRWQKEFATFSFSQDAFLYAMPAWLMQKIKQTWPLHWEIILSNSNQKPPFELRINLKKITQERYLALLEAQALEYEIIPALPSAIRLKKPMNVAELPGFSEGLVSVQAAGAQWAAYLLDIKENASVLDACAAPGGKTIHLLEQANHIQVTALDIDETRLLRVQENLKRTGYSALLQVADVTALSQDAFPKHYDRILLDAPCSATGVIARHPDIKHLRLAQDIVSLAKTQMKALSTLWQFLKPGGILLYATCSILKEENDDVIEKFLKLTKEARVVDIEAPIGEKTAFGRQLLPNKTSVDGFYYAKLVK